MCIKEDGNIESFGAEYASKTPPVCIERFEINKTNKSYQYAPRLVEPPQISSLISDKAAFAIVQKIGTTKALELYPHNETIFRYSLLRISEIFPGTRLFKMPTEQLIDLSIAKIGAKKAISMFSSRPEVVLPAITKHPELFSSLNPIDQQDPRLAYIYVNKVGIETAIKAYPQNFAIKQLIKDKSLF